MRINDEVEKLPNATALENSVDPPIRIGDHTERQSARTQLRQHRRCGWHHAVPQVVFLMHGVKVFDQSCGSLHFDAEMVEQCREVWSTTRLIGVCSCSE
jgi:hypothetical protein